MSTFEDAQKVLDAQLAKFKVVRTAQLLREKVQALNTYNASIQRIEQTIAEVEKATVAPEEDRGSSNVGVWSMSNIYNGMMSKCVDSCGSI